MIKAITRTKDGRLLVLLGLSRMNTTLLHQDKPIEVDLREYAEGAPTVLIFAGETEAEMRGAIEVFIGPDTKIDDRTVPG